MIRARSSQETRERTSTFGALLEPHRVYAVAGAKHVAAGEALMRLDELRPRASDSPADRITEGDIAPQPADVKRIDDLRLHQLQIRLGPLACVERYRHVALEQRLQRVLDEAFGAAVG